MPYIKDGPKRTIHIQFTPEEISTLEHKANAAGLKVPSFIRQIALNGRVKGYNLNPLLTHSVAVGEVAAAIRDMVAKEHPNRDAYEADLEKIQDQLAELIKSENELLGDLTRRLKR